MKGSIKLYSDIPQSAKSFLSYLQNIKGKSDKTIHEYYYDLRTFFRFMKCYRNLSSFELFSEINCSDLDIEFIKTIRNREIRPHDASEEGLLNMILNYGYMLDELIVKV